MKRIRENSNFRRFEPRKRPIGRYLVKEAAPKDRLGSENVSDVKDAVVKLPRSITSNFARKELTKIIQSVRTNSYFKVLDNNIKFSIQTQKSDGTCISIYAWGPDFANDEITVRTARFLASCGLDVTGEPDKTINGEILGYGFDLYRDDEEVKNCIKFFHNFNSRVHTANNSYNTVKDMDDEAYNIYKGNAPSKDFNLYWTFETFDDSHPYELVLSFDHDGYFKATTESNSEGNRGYKQIKPLVNTSEAIEAILYDVLYLPQIIKNLDEEDQMGLAEEFELDPTSSYTISEGISDYIKDVASDSVYSLQSIDDVKCMVDIISKELKNTFGLIDDVNVEVKLNVNDARAKKLKKHPELKTQFESRKRVMRKLTESHSWDDFNSPEADALSNKYLPVKGDGDNQASQAVTAASKLIYKWFNDGDVYDNHYALEGWANDISGSANWLYNYIPGAADILKRIETISDADGYDDILWDIYNLVFDKDLLTELETKPKVGDAYREEGPFEFEELPTCSCCGERISLDDFEEYDGMCFDCYEAEQEDEDDCSDW